MGEKDTKPIMLGGQMVPMAELPKPNIPQEIRYDPFYTDDQGNMQRYDGPDRMFIGEGNPMFGEGERNIGRNRNVGLSPNVGLPPEDYTYTPSTNNFFQLLLDEPQPYSYNPVSNTGMVQNRTRGKTPNRSTMMSPYAGFPNFNNPNIVPTQARVPQAPPAGYRPGIDPEWNYFPTSNPPASTMGQYPYGITPPTIPPTGIGSGLGSFPGLHNLFGGINIGDTTAGGLDMSNLFQNQNTFQQPVIDYDLLASKINVPDFGESQFQMPDFQMPDYSDQFSNLQQGLGGLTDQFSNFQMPTYEVPDFDYNQLASNLAGQIDFPTYDVPDYSGQFQGLQSGIGNLTDIFGNFQMPTYETPDYSQQFSDLSSRLGGLESLMRTINNQENNIISGNKLTFAEGGDIRYQEGQGIAGLDDGMMTEGNEQLIQAAIMVIQGMAPDQETADAVINQFIGLYGQEAFMSLREQVLNPDGQAQTQGMIEGFGGGMDDFVQGVAGNQNRIAASPGEYIVPADVVSQLGDGNSEEGSRKLDGMLDRTRMAKTGTIKQAEPIDSRQVMPV